MISFLKRYVVHNFGLKVLSLLLATGLWFMISRDEQPAEVAVRAPIVFQNVPANLEFASNSIPETQIRVRGPERVVRHLTASDVQAEIDLSGTGPQERTFELTPLQIRHPREVAVMQIVPSQLELNFDTRMTRDVEIRPNVTVPDGTRISKIEVDPARVTITGPRRHVERVESATTDPINARTGGTAVFISNVFVSDPLVQVDNLTAVRVTVTLEKAASTTTR
jgi:YbbR domain-containing protein